ncbi:hypothetical protein ABPG75_012189 [Micractinium tetrahymenae]
MLPTLRTLRHVTSLSIEAHSLTISGLLPIIELPDLSGLPLSCLRMGIGVGPHGGPAGLAPLSASLCALAADASELGSNLPVLSSLSGVTALELRRLRQPLPRELCTALTALPSLACLWPDGYAGQLLPPEACLTRLTLLQLTAPRIPQAPPEAFTLPMLRALSLVAYQGAAPELPAGPCLSSLEALTLLGNQHGAVPAALSGAVRLRKLRIYLSCFHIPGTQLHLLASELPALQQLAVACQDTLAARHYWCSRLLHRRPSLVLFLEQVRSI